MATSSGSARRGLWHRIKRSKSKLDNYLREVLHLPPKEVIEIVKGDEISLDYYNYCRHRVNTRQGGLYYNRVEILEAKEGPDSEVCSRCYNGSTYYRIQLRETGFIIDVRDNDVNRIYLNTRTPEIEEEIIETIKNDFYRGR